jgi:hypothetical protein
MGFFFCSQIRFLWSRPSVTVINTFISPSFESFKTNAPLFFEKITS